MRWINETTHPQRVIILLHGYLGNEYAMDIFGKKLGKGSAMVSPRAYYSVGPENYSWADPDTDERYALAAYRAPAERLHRDLLSELEARGMQHLPRVIIGFSQGAAMAYTMAALYPESYNHIIALSGFMPSGLDAAIRENSLPQLRAYISHGLQDDIVPLSAARQARDTLLAAGSDVNYCEGKGRHKISVECLKDIAASLGV